MYAQEANDFEIEEVTVVQRKKGKVKSRTEAFDTEKINSQLIFGQEASKNSKSLSPQHSRVFIPEMKA